MDQMDLVFSLSNRLRHYAEYLRASANRDVAPPSLEEWLRYWNDDDTDLGNLRNLEHWLERARPRG